VEERIKEISSLSKHKEDKIGEVNLILEESKRVGRRKSTFKEKTSKLLKRQAIYQQFVPLLWLSFFLCTSRTPSDLDVHSLL
jgi:hypothetical protein